MEIVDARREPIDVSQFVTYQTEEDLTPTAAELIEELPERAGFTPVAEYVEPKEKKPYRGVGYLRAEAPPEAASSGAKTDESTTDEWDEFGIGIGIDAAPPSKTQTRDSTGASSVERTLPIKPQHSQSSSNRGESGQPKAGQQSSGNTAEDSSSGEQRRVRKRRRSRRGGSRGEGGREGGREGELSAAAMPHARTASPSNPEKTNGETSSGTSGERSAGPTSSHVDGAPTGEKRKRRRRGRKRKKATPGPDAPSSPET